MGQNYPAPVGFLPEPDFCRIWKKCRIPAGAGAEIRYSPNDSLHWFDVPERVKYKVIILTRRCLVGTALRYLGADCVSDSEMVQRHYTLYRGWS